MKNLISLGALMLFFSVMSFANENSGGESENNAAIPHTWYCTAYDSHGHGYSCTDRHYDHAYHCAVDTCERRTGQHCHDVHCHEHAPVTAE